MNTDVSVLEQGIIAADVDGDGPEAAAEARRKQAEYAQVRQWWSTLDTAREYDEDIRKAYARDRRYARGDSGHEVSVPLIGCAIDTMKSFIYARDPSVDCVPAQMVEAPKEPMPVAPVQPPGLAGLMQDPGQVLNDQAAVGAAAQGGIEAGLMQVGASVAEQQARYQQELAEYEAKLAEWQQQQEQRRVEKRQRALYAQTMEVVITKLWKKAKIKRKARKTVGSGLTTGIGWAKATWQERTQKDPVIAGQIEDLKNLLTRITREQEALEQGECAGNEEEARLRIQQQIAALEEKVFVTLQRGFSLEFVPCQNMQVPPGIGMMDCADGPWLAEYLYPTIADAKVMFPDLPLEKLRTAQRYSRAKPMCDRPAPESPVSASEADEFTSATEMAVNHKPSDDDYIQVAEVWSIDDGNIYTLIRGVDCYAKPPSPPNIKSARFYAHFPLAFIEEDGERAPTSMTQRSWKLQNEYNGRRSSLKKTRQRSFPGILFDAGQFDEHEVGKIMKGSEQEYIPVRPTVPGTDIRAAFTAKPVSSIDPALYDTAPILRDFERVWGTQEALQGSIESAKTATEAEIQQTGFQSRTGSMRDSLEDWLSEIASYTAVIAAQMLTPEDVMELAGPDAVWPTLESIDELESLINVDIRAGSTGKPNSRLEREAWAAVAPQLQAAAVQIGQMRGSSPSEVADKLESLAQETATRAGDGTLDVSKFIPQNEGMQAPQGAPAGPMPASIAQE